MISAQAFKKMALDFPHVEEVKHFDRLGYKLQGKRMFATYLASAHSVNIFLSPQEQQVFCALNTKHIYPVPNKWGEKGATTFELSSVEEDVLKAALESAYSALLK